jgi:ferric-dicitrate binding protein FerR (iron transport regulator)
MMNRELPWHLITGRLKDTLTVAESAEFDKWLAQEGNSELFANFTDIWNDVRADVATLDPDIDSRRNQLIAHINKSKQVKRRRLRPTMIAVAASVAAIFAIGLWAVDKWSVPTTPDEFRYSTLSGKSKVYLPDGTLVWLHNNSSISYNDSFGDSRRDVEFTGEAYFEVAHNKSVPFTVRTGDLTVRVHGTKFNLRNRTMENKTTVSLVEGSVSVVSDRDAEMITPGYEAVYNKTSDRIYTAKGDVELARDWASESISFNDKSLEFIAERLSKWYDVDIHLTGRTSGDDITYSFTVRHEPLEEIVRLIKHLNPAVNYAFDEHNTLYINVKPK